MSVTVELPVDVERKLRERSANLDAEAKEAMLIELYRLDKLSQAELALSLGLDRLQMEAVLKRHEVVEDLATNTEYDAALRRLRIPPTK